MMDLCWCISGALTAGCAIFLWKLSERYQWNWLSWSGLIMGLILILFSMAWGTGAVLEGVPRAAGMGFLLFGFSGIVLVTLSLKYILRTPVEIFEETPLLEKSVDIADSHTTLESDQESDQESGLAPEKKDKKEVSKIIPYLAYGTLVIAFIIGMIPRDADYEFMISKKYPERVLNKIRNNPVVFELDKTEPDVGEYIIITQGQGYGGPFTIGVHLGDDAWIHRVMLLDNRETPAFVKKVEDANFPAQFIGKHVTDDFIAGVDIDIISGATVSTRAATEAIRDAAHIAASDYFKFESDWKNQPWVFGLSEIMVLVLFILAFFKQVYAKKPWRYVYMVSTVAIVGFYLNAAISVGSLSGLFMGFIPDLKTHIIWWILVVGTVLTIIVKGKNVYCYRICPFYGVGYLLNKAGGAGFQPSGMIRKRARQVINFLLWLSLMIIFLSSNPGAGSFEPFAMMFSLNGIGIHWFLLPLILTGSFFTSAFWCRFFCPCGHALSALVRFRKKAVRFIDDKRRNS